MLEQSDGKVCSLPLTEVELPQINVLLKLLNSNDKDFYFDLYRNPKLMQHIKGPLSLALVKRNFIKCLFHNNKTPPSYVSYVIKNNEKLLGVMSLKPVVNRVIEVGIIIDTPHQGAGWSSIIKKSLYAYLFNSHQIDSFVSYCDENNLVANHINEKLGFELQAHAFNQRFNRVVKKWVCYASTLEK